VRGGDMKCKNCKSQMYEIVSDEFLMEEIFDLIIKLRKEIEKCESSDNGTQTGDAIQTINKIDYLLITKIGLIGGMQ
jgi:hypothetical protein